MPDPQNARSRVSPAITRTACSVALAALTALLAACTVVIGSRRPITATEFWGFTAPWDARSGRSVAAFGGQLDAVVTGWYTLDSVSFRPVRSYPDTLVGRSGASSGRYMALLTSYQGTRFHAETVRGLSQDPAALANAASALASTLGASGYSGLIMDFEGLAPGDLDALVNVSRAIADSARAHGVSQAGIAVPAQDTAAYPARPLLSAADFIVVMLYDQHWRTSPPGPISAPEWAARQLGVRAGEVGASKLVAAFPLYGYRWRRDTTSAEVLSYAQARTLAGEAGVSLERDPSARTLRAARDSTWTIWVSDATLLATLVRDARRIGVTRIALWRLGLEDPDVWSSVVR